MKDPREIIDHLSPTDSFLGDTEARFFSGDAIRSGG